VALVAGLPWALLPLILLHACLSPSSSSETESAHLAPLDPKAHPLPRRLRYGELVARVAVAVAVA
jgi:hypothetical protein